MNWLAVSYALGAVGIPILTTLWAIWVSGRTAPWQVKYLAVALASVPLLLIRAPEVMLVLILQGWIVLLITQWIGRWHRSELQSRATRQIQIADIFGVTALAAIVMAVFAQFETHPTMTLTPIPQHLFAIARLICWGPLLAASTLAIMFLWQARKKFRHLCLFMLLLSISFAGAVWHNQSLIALLQMLYFMIPSGDFFSNIQSFSLIDSKRVAIVFALYLGGVSAWMSFLTWAFGFAIQPHRTREIQQSNATQESNDVLTSGKKIIRRLTHWAVRVPAMLSCLVLLAAVGTLYWGLLPPPEYHPEESYDSSRPNGLLDMIAAARDLNPVLDTWPPVPLGKKSRSQIDANADCFHRFEEAIDRGNFARYDWDNHTNLLALPGDSFVFSYDGGTKLRNIARAFNFRGLQALNDERHDEVVDDAIRIFKVAEATNQDPSMIALLVATAMEGLGYSTAFSGISGGSNESLNRMSQQIQAMIDRNPDALTEMERTARLEAWIIWKKGRLLERFTAGLTNDESAFDNVFEVLLRRNSQRRLLLTEIAIEQFRRQHKRLPNSLDDLTPDYLGKVPEDPFNTQQPAAPLSYRLSENAVDYVLYSFGPNRIDDQGEIVDGYPEGDLNFRAEHGDLIAQHAASVEEHEAEQKAMEADYDDELLEDDELDGLFDEP